MDCSGKRVLIVEDDSVALKVITMVVKCHGMSVLTSGTIKQTEELLGKEAVDLIILDRILPDGDGASLFMKLKKSPELSRIPVLILSGMTKAEEQVEGFDLGADDYITKPYSLLDLMARVKVLLRRARKFQLREAESFD